LGLEMTNTEIILVTLVVVVIFGIKAWLISKL